MAVCEIKERVEAGIIFGKGIPKPKWFIWKSKRIEIKSVNYTWNTVEGDAVILHFSATGDNGNYEISFNHKNLECFLEKTDVE
jgi:hypothetical protein